MFEYIQLYIWSNYTYDISYKVTKEINIVYNTLYAVAI